MVFVNANCSVSYDQLRVRLCLREAHHFHAFLKLPTLLEKFHPLEAFKDISLRDDRAGSFEASMLRHNNQFSYLFEIERQRYDAILAFQLSFC
jgi:hypothetical protein